MKTFVRNLKVILLITGIALSTGVLANRHIITASGITFTPSNLQNVEVGDSIVFTWGSGTHTTTSLVIPAGAATWDSPLTSTSTTFIYPVTLSGTYNYECTIHAAMGMRGSFTVRNPSSISESLSLTPVISVYPNPIRDIVYYKYESKGKDLNRLEIYNVTGMKVFEITNDLQSGAESKLNMALLNPGIYFLKFIDSENHSWVRRVSKE